MKLRKNIIIITLAATASLFLYKKVTVHTEVNTSPNNIKEIKPRVSDYKVNKKMLVRIPSESGIKAYELEFSLYAENILTKNEIEKMGTQFDNIVSVAIATSDTDTPMAKKGQKKISNNMISILNDFLTHGEVLSVSYAGSIL